MIAEAEPRGSFGHGLPSHYSEKTIFRNLSRSNRMGAKGRLDFDPDNEDGSPGRYAAPFSIFSIASPKNFLLVLADDRGWN
jgi:hypothetical protein